MSVAAAKTQVQAQMDGYPTHVEDDIGDIKSCVYVLGDHGRQLTDGASTRGAASSEDCANTDSGLTNGETTGYTTGQEQSSGADDNSNLSSLKKDGPVTTAGSIGHPNECTPCAFYCFALRGCRYSAECSYCHLNHESKLRQRKEEWKRTQRDKRQREKKERRADDSSLLEEGSSSQGEVMAQAPASTNYQASPQAYSRPGATLAPASAIRGTEPEAWMTRPPSVYPAPAQLPRPFAQKAARNHAVPPNSFGGEVSSLRRTTDMLAAEWGGRPTAGMQHAQVQEPSRGQMRSHRLEQHPRGHAGIPPADRGPAGPPGPRAASPEFFSYTPDETVVVAVGQTVEIWPPVELITQGHTFAVSPALPEGVRLDERLGLIHGKPQESTSGIVTFFVTACRPGDPNMVVKMAMVNLKVLDVRVQGHQTMSIHQPEPGVTVLTLREDDASAEASARNSVGETSDAIAQSLGAQARLWAQQQVSRQHVQGQAAAAQQASKARMPAATMEWHF